MSAPCSLCLEDLTVDDLDRRFLRCVALPGRQPGLRLHTDGSVGWQTSQDIACELMVSMDQRLLLFRPRGAPDVQVRRGGRVLNAPCDKPVILLDADEVWVAGRRLRVHIHGETTQVVPPSFLARALSGSRSAAAMMALGATVLACDSPSFDGRPTATLEPTTDADPTASATVEAASVIASAPSPTPSAPAASSARPAASSSAAPAASSSAPAPPPPKATRKRPPRKPPIEVRDMPPFAE
jgi:hypothetical protein